MQLAKVLGRRKEIERAREAVELALGYHQAALNSSPRSPKYREDPWNDHVARSTIQRELRDVAGAATDAEQLPRICPDHPNSYLKAAALLIDCATVSPDQRTHFHDRAMELLGSGVNQNQLDRSDLGRPELRERREREDFRRLRQSTQPPVAG